MSSQRSCGMSSAGLRRAISTTPTLASSMTSGKRHVSMCRRTSTPCMTTAATMTAASHGRYEMPSRLSVWMMPDCGCALR